MSTDQPSPPSPNDQPSTQPELQGLHDKLKDFKVDPTALAICLIGPAEMIFGEVENHELFQNEEGQHGSLLAPNDGRVVIRNPRRLTRHTMIDRNTNQLGNQMVFSDFDFMNSGLIEVAPTAGFFLDWCDTVTQTNYCGAYANFLEGRRRAQAEAAGIHIPEPGMPGNGARGNLRDLLSRKK